MNNMEINKNEIEELIDEKNLSMTIYPIKYPKIWESYKLQQAAFWTTEELDFSNDYNDFCKLTENEQYFIKMILGFFAASDIIVNINLGERFIKDVKIREAIVTYNYQMMIENIHCVSYDTLILTDCGYNKIGELENKHVNVWNGKTFSNTIVKFTGYSNLYNIKLSNGMELKCTPEHKWFIFNKYTKRKEKIMTKDLKLNYKIYDYDLPLLNYECDDNFINSYIHGYFCGNGKTYNNKHFIYNNFESLELYRQLYHDNIKDKKILDISDKINKKKYFVPINYSIETKLMWLEGVCDSIIKKIDVNKIELKHTNFKFLQNIQLMLTTLGVKCIVKFTNKLKKRKVNYIKIYSLNIDKYNTLKLSNLGFLPEKLKIINKNNHRISNINKHKKLPYIKSITIYNDIEKTFCFSEKFENAGIFNGILTGQSETYSLQIDNIIRDSNEKNKLLNAIKYYPCINKKALWAHKWIDSDAPFAQRLIGFVIVEGLFFSGSFCAIFWLKNRNIMHGLCDSNELIARDEGMHTNHSILLYSMIKNKIDEEIVKNMFIDAVEIENEFICESLSCSLLGMNKDSMNTYIKYVADRLLVSLNYKKIWNVQNPFDFMENISMEGKTNFFESRPTQYQKSAVLNTSRDKKFEISDDF